MVNPEQRELMYFCMLPVDELSDHICYLPYTMLELILDTALTDEDGFMMDMFDIIMKKLKENLCYSNSKRALRKLLVVCQTLYAVGYFDFGEWELFRENMSDNNNPVEKNPSNNKPLEVIQELIDAGFLKPEPSNGKYEPYKSMPQFIQVCVDQNYGHIICSEFIHKNIVHNGVSIKSLNEYIRAARRVNKVQ